MPMERTARVMMAGMVELLEMRRNLGNETVPHWAKNLTLQLEIPGREENFENGSTKHTVLQQTLYWISQVQRSEAVSEHKPGSVFVKGSVWGLIWDWGWGWVRDSAVGHYYPVVALSTGHCLVQLVVEAWQ
jgi:hypothetical protein